MQFQGFDWLSSHGIMSHFTMPNKKRPINCLLVVLVMQNRQDQAIFLDHFFNKIIILLTLVGHEMIVANLALSIISYPMRARGIIVNYTIPDK